MSEFPKKKMIDLGLAEEFCYDLKFKVDLPDPTYHTKYLFLPNKNDNIYDAKFTSLNLQNKPKYFPNPNLNIKI